MHLLEAHAEACQNKDLSSLLSWELLGAALQPEALSSLMVKAYLELGRLLLPSEPSGAWEAGGSALALAPQHARAHLLQAQALKAQGQFSAAAQAAQAAQERIRPEETKLEREIQAFLSALHP